MTGDRLPEPGRAPTACHVCGAGAVELFPDFGELARVTSDCQPWPRGGKLGACGACGTVQKVVDAGWTSEVEEIYKAYSIYQQSRGVEQATFGADKGEVARRSSRILNRLIEHVPLREAGRLLDVGCGNGAMLRAFSSLVPGWVLAGTEFDDKHRAAVEAIPGVEALHACGPEAVPGEFDLVSMIHALEHFADPREVLARVRGKLVDGGLLLVEVPDHRQNPFELTIADHASHFVPRTLSALVRGAGFEVVSLADDWVSKELTLVARKTGTPGGPPPAADPAASRELVRNRLEWLRTVRREALRAASAGTLGLFGSSIAATWVVGELGDAVEFFVDEDPSRAGGAHLGRPIYRPDEAPTGSDVFIALPPASADSILRRLRGGRVTYHRPPAFPEAVPAGSPAAG